MTMTAEEDRAFREAVEGDLFSIEVMTAKAICELPAPDGSGELLGRFAVRRQRTVIGADTGAGKSTMAFHMLSGICHAREFLGTTGVGGRALVIDAEQGIETIKLRLREAGLDTSENVDFIRVPDGLALDHDDEQAAVIEQQIAIGDYAVVLADPLYKLHQGDSNDERQAVDLMRRFDGWREKYGFALILLVHTRKPPAGAKFTMHEFFGSSAYMRGAEIILGLQFVRDGYSRLHFFKDRDGGLPTRTTWGLLFDRDSGYSRDPDDEKPKQTARQVIEELVVQQPDITTAQIIAVSGYKERTVQNALKDIGATGEQVGRNTQTSWTLDGGTE
jgi:AAA domain